MKRRSTREATRRVLRRKNVVDDDSEEEEDEVEQEEEEEEDPTPVTTRSQRARRRVDDDDDDESNEEEEEKEGKEEEDDDEEEEEEEEEEESEEDAEEDEEEDDDEEEDEDADEEEETKERPRPTRGRATPLRSASTKTRAAKTRASQANKDTGKVPKTRKEIVDDDDDSDNSEVSMKEESPKPKTPFNRPMPNKVVKKEDTSSKDEDDSGSTSGQKRKLSDASSSAVNTPNASPARRMMKKSRPNSPATPIEDISSSEVPFQDIRETLRTPKSEEDLLSAITDLCDKVIKTGRSPSRLFTVGFLQVVKEDVERFRQASVQKYLLRMLRSKHYAGVKDTSSVSDFASKNPRSSPASSQSYAEIPLPVLIANVLVQVLKGQDEWPVDTVKVFLDDSVTGRTWVDHELSQVFVQNVKTLLKTPTAASGDSLIRQRYHGEKTMTELYGICTQHIKFRLGELDKERSSHSSSSLGSGGSNAARNLILTLLDFVSLPEARVGGAEHMETWLQNPSVKGPAKDLLSQIVNHCTTTETLDMKTVDLLLKLKLKSTMFQLKVETISRLVLQNRAYLKLGLSVYVSRQRPNNIGKDVDNMKMLQHIFRAARSHASSSSVVGRSDDSFYTVPMVHQGAVASTELAHVFRELAATSEFAPVLRSVAKKILTQLTFEQVDIKALCTSLLDNEPHWETLTKVADSRLADHMGLVASIAWLVLFMRGTAVKSLQIQQSSGSGRSGGNNSSIGPAVKLGATQSLSRRGPQSGSLSRMPKLGSRDPKAKVASGKHGGSTPPGSTSSTNEGTAGTPGSSNADNKHTVKVHERAKEELLQALAHAQRSAVVCCLDLFQRFSLTGASPFEKMLYEVIVKRLLFLDIPSDVHPTEHDRTCFQSTKEDIPLHEDTFGMLTTLYATCSAVDRTEALRTLETVVCRAADGQLRRESQWKNRESDLAVYRQNGGVVGVQVKDVSFLENLFALVKISREQINQDVDLCHSNRYWIVCSVLMVLAAFNPSTVGDYLWQHVPMLRCLMQMAITGKYSFIPVESENERLLGKHRGNVEGLKQGNQQLSEYERQLLLQVGQNPPFSEDPPMVFEPEGMAREPPQPVLDHLYTLDKKFHIGTRLRQSRSNDFLMEMVTGSESLDATSGAATDSSWIVDIVCEDMETVEYLPSGCLCKLLLLAEQGTSALNDQSTAEWTQKNEKMLRQLVPKLLSKLKEYIFEPKVKSGPSCSEIIGYYLDCLMSDKQSTRRAASRVLYLLTCSNDSPSVALDDDINFQWLNQIAKMDWYADMRSRIFSSLEKLLEMESSLASLRLGVQALYDFWEESSGAEGLKNKTEDAGLNDIDQSILLATTFGKLLVNREFVSDLLLQDEHIYGIALKVLWRAISAQLRGKPSVKANFAANLSECKIFYVVDSSHNVREIKLPVCVTIGTLHLLCSPHAHGEGRNQELSSSFRSIVRCLFPKKEASKGMMASTGLLASKDPKLYPSEVMSKLAFMSKDAHVSASAVQALPLREKWTLLTKSGLSAHVVDVIVKCLMTSIQSNEKKVEDEMQTSVGVESTQVAASSIHVFLEAMKQSLKNQSSTKTALDGLLDWVKKRTLASDKHTVSEVDDLMSFSSFQDRQHSLSTSDDEQVACVSGLFTTWKDKSEDVNMTPASSSSPKSVTTADMFKTEYFGKKDCPQVFNEAVGKVKTEDTNEYSYASIEGMIKTCVSSDASVMETWRMHTSILHALHLYCHSPAASERLASVLMDVVGHIITCKNAHHQRQCLTFLRQAFSSSLHSLSAVAMHSFMQRIAHSSVLGNGLQTCNVNSFDSILRTLELVVTCLNEGGRKWMECGHFFRMDMACIHGWTSLIKNVSILRKHLSRDATDLSTLLQPLFDLTRAQEDDDQFILLMDAVLAANAHVKSVPRFNELNVDIQEDMVTIVYSKDPLLTSEVLSELQPGWEALVNFHTLASSSSTTELKNLEQFLQHVDKTLENLDTGSLDAVDRFRELVIAAPLVMTLWLPRRLQRIAGKASLAQLYSNLSFYQSVLTTLEVARPLLKRRPDVLVEPVCNFLVELLEVIVGQPTAEFYSLVSRTWSLLFDALDSDCQRTLGLLVEASNYTIIENVMSAYSTHADTKAFGELLSLRHDGLRLRQALSTTAATSRTSQCLSVEEQRELDAFVSRAQAAVTELAPAPFSLLQAQVNEADVQQNVKRIQSACDKADVGLSPSPRDLSKWSIALSNLLYATDLPKSVMTGVCQTLLTVMKTDTSTVMHSMESIVECLEVLRSGPKDAVLSHIVEFLSFANARQRRRLIGYLFQDQGDLARSKLSAYVKTPAFKASYLLMGPSAV